MSGSLFSDDRYYWGQNGYLPNFFSRRIISGNFRRFCVYERESLGELLLNHPAKITLPRFVAN